MPTMSTARTAWAARRVPPRTAEVAGSDAVGFLALDAVGCRGERRSQSIS